MGDLMRFFRRKQAKTFFGITPETLPHLVNTYVAKLETEESAEWCKCVWRIHPDDQGVKPGHCRSCGEKVRHANHNSWAADLENYSHPFAGIRRVRVDNHSMCPVHTKEGLIAGFVEWLADNGDAHVRNTGNAIANGPGSVANTGIMRNAR